METQLQQVNDPITRIFEAIESQQQKNSDFKGKFENLMSQDEEVDMQRWYSQSQVNQLHVDEISLLKSLMDQKEINLV